jgi:catechol 2,3-dioxygenase-like lactoylglutathione lyase family enzyme
MTRYLHTIYRITDPERSREFYEALGFEYRRELPIVRDGGTRGDELLLRHTRPGGGAGADVQPRWEKL